MSLVAMDTGRHSARHELLPDGRASAFASRVDSSVEAVGAIDGTTERRG
jgi:hypothetical protein